MSNIEKYFAGKSVLVTGATGFVGKVLVEKLLRSIELIQCVYIIIRTKRDESPDQRFSKYINNPVFARLRGENPEKFSKLKLVPGDLSIDGLDISEENRIELTNNVGVVFHSAANVRFDVPLLEILKTNLMGTHRVLTLAQQIKKLEAFVFVSTSYSQTYQLDLDEKYYPTGYNIFDLISAVDSDDHTTIEKIHKDLSKLGHPSTYTMSKAFAEELVHEYRSKLPVAIVRPSVIVCAVDEPEPGFVQGFQTFTGVTAGVMTGLVRVIPFDPEVVLKVIPVDFVVSAIVAVGHKTSQESSLGICHFYNVSDNGRCPNQGECRKLWMKVFEPFVQHEKLFWYPRTTPVYSIWLFTLMFIFVQLIPAILLDFVLLVMGKKPLMVSLQKNIYRAVVSYERFMKNDYKISIENTQELFKQLNDEDKQRFMFDIEQIDWISHGHKQLKGIRKFLFREEDGTIPKAQAKLKKLYILDIAFKGLLGLIALRFLKNLFSVCYNLS